MTEVQQGRVALVTGAAQGIGRAIARALADDGCRVAIADLRHDAAQRVAEEIEQAGGTALGVAMDITEPQQVARALARVDAAFGAVEVLVNNAGWDELHPFLETDEVFWDRVLDVNLKGGLRLARALVPAMVAGGWGRVVNIGSDAGRVGSSNEAVYSAAKGGVIAFTKTLAREVARDGVTANTVCPGPTDTPLLTGMAGAGGERMVTALERAIPMRRLGRPQEVAAAVRFLAGEDAGFITGQTLSVSGGLTMA
jgi:2-hydroxycyclohexanecarboxyl-CoA dehydrogenase